MLRRLAASFCCCGLLATLAAAQPAGDQEADHDALRALVAEYEKAIAAGDPSVLKPHLADDFTGVMVTGEPVDGYDALVAYWEKIQGMLGEGGTYSVDVTVAELATIVGDVAYAYGTTQDRAVTSDGDEYLFEGQWTAVCRREGDAWKVVRIHGAMDAITNTFVLTALGRTSLWSGLLGGAAGLVFGGGVTWLLARQSREQRAN